jgi:hypothetical protein
MVRNVVEGAKRKVPGIQAAVERELVFPLLRGGDVSRWAAKPSLSILLTHEKGQRLNAIPESQMQQDYPKSYVYLKRFESILSLRKTRVIRNLTKTGPFYSIFGIGDYTFAPWKVVWGEVATELDAAVVGESNEFGSTKAIIPDHTCILVQCEKKLEAYYLCAALNSGPARLAIRNYIVLHPDPHVLENVGVPKFSAENKTHHRLAELSEAAHRAAGKSEKAEVKSIEEEIDRWAAKLWELSDEEVAEMKRSLEEM